LTNLGVGEHFRQVFQVKALYFASQAFINIDHATSKHAQQREYAFVDC
jgi:hypothetical protein